MKFATLAIVATASAQNMYLANLADLQALTATAAAVAPTPAKVTPTPASADGKTTTEVHTDADGKTTVNHCTKTTVKVPAATKVTSKMSTAKKAAVKLMELVTKPTDNVEVKLCSTKANSAASLVASGVAIAATLFAMA